MAVDLIDDSSTPTPESIDPSSSPEGNYFRQSLKPTLFCLNLLGFARNNGPNRFLRYSYNVYFTCILAVCAYVVYSSYFVTIVKALQASTISNLMDKYGWWSALLIYLYNLATVLIFFICLLKSNRFSNLINILDGREFKFLHDHLRSSDYLKFRIRKLLIQSYVACAIFVVEILAFPIVVFVIRGWTLKNLLYSLSAVPSVLVTLSFSFAFAFYSCTAELWTIFNHSITEDGSTRRLKTKADFDRFVSTYSDRYDSVSSFTNRVARIFRYYAIVHVVTVLYLITQTYQTLFDDTLPFVYKVFYWIDAAVQLTPLFAAALVSTQSSKTAVRLHTVYKNFISHTMNNSSSSTNETNFSSSTSSTNDEPIASREYFHFYRLVANQDLCGCLDIAGVLQLNTVTVAALAFAAVNWCAVIMQFRQGANGELASVMNATVNATG